MDGGVREDRTLRRIVALLAALALLAERAAVRSLPVRIVVLCLLRHAKAVAIAYAVDATRLDLSGFDDGQSGYAPLDAAVLALRLRLLAALLSACLRGTSASDGRSAWQDPCSRRTRAAAHRAVATVIGRVPELCDTS